MDIKVNELELRIARRVKLEREARQWSIGELATRSGVSKAMISKIERGETSPTAVLLGRLSAAFGMTLSTLLSRAEDLPEMLARTRSQEQWVDPATGFRRIAVSPQAAPVIQLVKGELPAGATIDYPAGAFTFVEQQILVLSGTLTFTDGPKRHVLKVGDCLALGPPADRSFANETSRPCTYLVVIARKS